MRSLQVPSLGAANQGFSLHEIAASLNGHDHLVDIAPWKAFRDKPKVGFSIAHNSSNVFIKYDVTEKEVLARYRHINDPVFKDSCVEFFISFNNEPDYYNIEFNRLGTCLGRYGRERDDRIELPVELLKTIKYERTLRQVEINHEPEINWTLTVAVPINIFCYHNFETIGRRNCRMNFYKCGDDLSHPHYLAWNNIDWPEPNFHLPQFFGKVEFL
ncbi:MAG TPA: carbohydrate-binding family 9-like protein [Mucilaginibacter sp.]|jgi:hypothetical protein|nr:carbohydrate-binding family 9-like protein [Mucilaginibacter sp.]